MKLNKKEKKRIEEKKIDVLIGNWRKNIINPQQDGIQTIEIASKIEERIDPMLQKQYPNLKDMIIFIEKLLSKYPEIDYDELVGPFQKKFGSIIISGGINDPLVLLKKILQAGQGILLLLITTKGGNHTGWKTEKIKSVVIISDVHYPYQMTIKSFPRPLMKNFESNKFHQLKLGDYIEKEVKRDE